MTARAEFIMLPYIAENRALKNIWDRGGIAERDSKQTDLLEVSIRFRGHALQLVLTKPCALLLQRDQDGDQPLASF